MSRWHSLYSNSVFPYSSPSPRAFLSMSGVHVNSVLSRFSLFSHRLHLLVEQILQLRAQVQLLCLLLNQLKMKLPHPRGMSTTFLREMMSRHCLLESHSWRRTSWSFRVTWLPKKLQLSVPLPAMATCLPKYRELPSNFYVRTRHVSQSSFGLQHV